MEFWPNATVIPDAIKPQHLFAPKDFEHGFLTVNDDVEPLYKYDAYYSKDSERGIRWNATGIAAPWPILDELHLSKRDREHLFPAETLMYFRTADNPIRPAFEFESGL